MHLTCVLGNFFKAVRKLFVVRGDCRQRITSLLVDCIGVCVQGLQQRRVKSGLVQWYNSICCSCTAILSAVTVDCHVQLCC